MALFNSFLGWFRGGGVLAEKPGEQHPVPGVQLVSDAQNIGTDGAMQIATVWSCVSRRANLVASLPFFVYQKDAAGQKTLDRSSRLYSLLHDSPNARMTPFEFWVAMMLNHDLRGNAYARIDRDERTGEAISLWPMPADQVSPIVLPDGTMVYVYTVAQDVAVLAEQNVLHLKDLGNGTIGLPKLEFMRPTTDEAAKAQQTASKIFGAQGKPTGVLMIDKVLSKEQRDAVKRNFGDMAIGNASRLFVLEANMKYQQLSLSPEDQQLLESRRFGVEEMCRWFDVPPVFVYHSNVTTWGTGVDSIIEGWFKVSIAPMLKKIEQAVAKRVLTPKQRAAKVAEFNFDALLRANLKDRLEAYAKAVQNGLKTRNECRQLENDPPMSGGDELTAQTNLAPLGMLGKTTPLGGSNAPNLPTAQ